MKLKIPPVVVTLISVLLMWLVAKQNLLMDLTIDVSALVTILLGLLSIVIGLIGVGQFSKNKTTVNPHKPENSSKLVDDGIYKYTRNPMYLALVIGLIAVGFYLKSMLSFVFIPIFIWFMNTYQIKPEEEMLIQIFGDKYRKYLETVRRWI